MKHQSSFQKSEQKRIQVNFFILTWFFSKSSVCVFVFFSNKICIHEKSFDKKKKNEITKKKKKKWDENFPFFSSVCNKDYLYLDWKYKKTIPSEVDI